MVGSRIHLWSRRILTVFLTLRTGIALVNYLSKPQLRKVNVKEKKNIPNIDVLIPARDEEARISKLLLDLEAIKGGILNVIVLDDNSTDRTAQVISSFKAVKLISGEALPIGWLGKNWACYQLSNQASSEFILFIDADVRVSKNALERAVNEMLSDDVDLLTIFPSQQIRSFGEMLTVPLMHYMLLSLLPLDLVHKLKNVKVVAANGQFMLFRREVYDHLKPHEHERASVIEDMAIATLLKEHRYKVKTRLGGEDVSCRMYNSFEDGINGFSKNLLPGFGNRPWAMYLYFYLTGIGFLLSLKGASKLQKVYWALTGLLLRTLIYKTGGYKERYLPWLYPLHYMTWVYIGVRSHLAHINKYNLWKGRNIHLPDKN